MFLEDIDKENISRKTEDGAWGLEGGGILTGPIKGRGGTGALFPRQSLCISLYPHAKSMAGHFIRHLLFPLGIQKVPSSPVGREALIS